MSVWKIGARTALAAAGELASLALMATPSWGAGTSCTGPLGPGTIKGNVSAGAGCEIVSGTTVTGNATVIPGGSLLIKYLATDVVDQRECYRRRTIPSHNPGWLG
jgi:hypothetical protein